MEQSVAGEHLFQKPSRSSKRKAAQPVDGIIPVSTVNPFTLLGGDNVNAGTRTSSPVRALPTRTSSLSSLTSPSKQMLRATSTERNRASAVSDARAPPADPPATSAPRSKKARSEAAATSNT
jgi:hypothetical protein